MRKDKLKIKNVRIIEYVDSYKNQYTKFLKKNENSMFYHTLKYKSFLEELLHTSSMYFIFLENNIIKGILPLMFKDGIYGRVYNSLPFYGSNGGIIAENNIVFELLLNKYIEIVNMENVLSSTLIEAPNNKKIYSILKINESDKRIGQWTSINYTDNFEKNIMNSFDSSARRNVRKAIKSNVKVTVDNSQIEFLYQTHYENITSIGGKAKDKFFFELIDKYFEKGIDYNIYLASLDNKKIGALLLFYHNKTVEYFTPAVISEYRNVQALPLIIYQAMYNSSESGFKWWNWGGTWISQEGVMKFKQKFGAIDKEYKYFIKINNQDIYSATKEELLEEYDNFYVIPFDKLKG